MTDGDGWWGQGEAAVSSCRHRLVDRALDAQRKGIDLGTCGGETCAFVPACVAAVQEATC